MNLADLIDEFQNHHKSWRNDGHTGVKNLCHLVHAIGYRDDQFGQFDQNGSYGNLINFLEDNPGAVETLINWLSQQQNDDWRENIEATLPGEIE